MKNFSQLVSEYIDRIGVSDSEIARRLGVSRQTIFRWREGKTSRPRNREDVLQLASKLRLSSEERDALLVAGGFHPEGSVDSALQSRSATDEKQFRDAFRRAPSNFLIGLRQRVMRHKKLTILITGLVVIAGFLALSGLWRDVASQLGFDVRNDSTSSLWPNTAAADETLILVSEFANYGSEQIGYNIAGRIQEALQQDLDETELESVRIELLPQTVSNERAAQHMGEQFHASLVIWGEYDSGRVIAIVSAPTAEERIGSSEQRWLIATSEELNSIVNTDLPRDVRWLSLYVLGRVQLSLQHYDLAERVFRRALIEDTQDASKAGRIYFFLGLIEDYAEDSNINEVIAYYSEAVEKFPELISAYNNRGVAYLNRGQAGDLERALADFQVATAEDESYEPAVINLAITLFRQDPGNQNEAIDLLLQFEAQHSKSADLQNTLCWYMSLAGRPEEALPHCDLAVEMNPSGYTNDSRGLALALLGRYTDAAQEFQYFLDTLASNNPPAYLYFGPTRSAWIVELEDGRNPFDAETLQALIEE